MHAGECSARSQQKLCCVNNDERQTRVWKRKEGTYSEEQRKETDGKRAA